MSKLAISRLAICHFPRPHHVLNAIPHNSLAFGPLLFFNAIPHNSLLYPKKEQKKVFLSKYFLDLFAAIFSFSSIAFGTFCQLTLTRGLWRRPRRVTIRIKPSYWSREGNGSGGCDSHCVEFQGSLEFNRRRREKVIRFINSAEFRIFFCFPTSALRHYTVVHWFFWARTMFVRGVLKKISIGLETVYSGARL